MKLSQSKWLQVIIVWMLIVLVIILLLIFIQNTIGMSIAKQACIEECSIINAKAGEIICVC